MARGIRAELKQKRPFRSLEEELYLNILRTQDILQRSLVEVLREARLSPPQYNVLRILRGAGPDGLACGEIGERMVTRDPDVTRLLDRLEKRNLAERSREKSDRRVVTVRIREAGLQLLDALDKPMARLHHRLLGHLGEGDQRQLIRLLEEVREGLR